MDTYSTITNPIDREKIHDLYITEKHLSETYNSFAGESSSRNLQQDLLTILNDEHELQFKLMEEMTKRGWHGIEYVKQEDIDKVKENYTKL